MPNKSGGQGLLPVAEALERILAELSPGQAETCHLADSMGRVLASDVAARLSLPVEPVSAMDGYAARVADCYSVGTILTRIGESAAGRPWTGTPCMEVHAFEYVMPLAYFELVRRSLCERRISLVVLVAGSALNLTRGFSKSCDYLGRVAAFFARSGFRVALRLGQPPDDDFRFFSRVSAYVPSGGAYSAYAAAVAEALGVHVIRPNRSLYAYAQPSGARCCDRNVDRSECTASFSVAEGAI